MDPVRVAVIGCGYWGPNLVRNFSLLPEFHLCGIADHNPERMAPLARQYRIDVTTLNAGELFDDPSIEAVAIATPISTHSGLAAQALRSGKHVMLAKPMAHSVAECDSLIALAAERGKVLLVDYTFLFTGAVERIRRLVDEGELGQLYYFDSVRVNLGLFQHDTNVLWDLAPHDLSIMLHLLQERPAQVMAIGASPVQTTGRLVESIAYLTMTFASGLIAHVNVNWLSPVKIRQVILGGSRKMVVWDDMEADTKVKVYDSGVEAPKDVEGVYRTLVQYRTGDMFAPHLDRVEALRKECLHFHRCVRDGEEPRLSVAAGRDLVAILEAAEASLRRGGVPVDVKL